MPFLGKREAIQEKRKSPWSYFVDRFCETMGLDLKNGTLFLPCAEMILPGPGQKWPSVKPGTMNLLVVSR